MSSSRRLAAGTGAVCDVCLFTVYRRQVASHRRADGSVSTAPTQVRCAMLNIEVRRRRANRIYDPCPLPTRLGIVFYSTEIHENAFSRSRGMVPGRRLCLLVHPDCPRRPNHHERASNRPRALSRCVAHGYRTSCRSRTFPRARATTPSHARAPSRRDRPEVASQPSGRPWPAPPKRLPERTRDQRRQSRARAAREAPAHPVPGPSAQRSSLLVSSPPDSARLASTRLDSSRSARLD